MPWLSGSQGCVEEQHNYLPFQREASHLGWLFSQGQHFNKVKFYRWKGIYKQKNGILATALEMKPYQDPCCVGENMKTCSSIFVIMDMSLMYDKKDPDE